MFRQNFLIVIVSVKHENINFNWDVEKKKFDKLFGEYKLADEGCNKFRYIIEDLPAWSNFDNEFIIRAERVNFLLFIFLFGSYI